jgi:hypothetical protein
MGSACTMANSHDQGVLRTCLQTKNHILIASTLVGYHDCVENHLWIQQPLGITSMERTSNIIKACRVKYWMQVEGKSSLKINRQ